ncbi:MAG: hypothetical protein LKM45_03815, partial [Wolbachia endosymbiont of Alcedoecus sp.]|nr:hypothetical protein [Wolbachia endosymbiont of Alcedoecus sp.]
ITLSKPELDLLRDPIKKMMELPPKPAINNENSVVPKPEVKERQGQENKKAIQSAQKPNVAAPLKKEPGRVPGASGIVFDFKGRREESASFEERRINKDVGGVGERGTASTGKYGITSSFDRERPKSSNKQENQFISCKRYINVNSFNKNRIKSTNEQELGDLYNELAKEVAKDKAKRKESAASIKHDYPIDHFQVPAETNGKSHANAKSKPKQGSVNNAQPKSECSSVKINNHVESIGKAPEEASRGI